VVPGDNSVKPRNQVQCGGMNFIDDTGEIVRAPRAVAAGFGDGA